MTTLFKHAGVLRTIPTISSREFSQRASQAKRATTNGPVFIIDRGRPAHVLMSFDDYQRLTKQRRNIADALAMPGVADIEFEPLRVIFNAQSTDFSSAGLLFESGIRHQIISEKSRY